MSDSSTAGEAVTATPRTPRPQKVDSKMVLQRSSKAVAVDVVVSDDGSTLSDLQKVLEQIGQSPELDRCLHLAVEKNRREFVVELLKRVKVFARNESFETPLIVAAKKGHLEIANLLIAEMDSTQCAKEKVCCQDSHEMNALHWALRPPADPKDPEDAPTPLPHLELAMLLLDKGIDVNSCDAEGWTSLHKACYDGQEEVVDVLLGRDGIDVNKVAEGDGWTPLHCAARAGNSAILNKLLDKGATASIDSKEVRRGDSPLSIGAWSGSVEICEILLLHKANLHRTTDKTGWTPLMKAAYKGYMKVVELLVKFDTSPKHLAYASDVNGYTPLHAAVASKNIVVVEYLLPFTVKKDLEEKAVIDMEAKELRRGDTPLSMAAFNGNKQIVEALVKNGAKVGAVDKSGWGLLHKAAYTGSADVVRYFIHEYELDPPLDVNLRANDYYTPLHAAAVNRYDNAEVVTLLLEAGATKSIEMKERHRDDSPLQLASFRGNDKVITALLDAGAKLDAEDREGWTALLKCAWSPRSKLSTLELLLERGANIYHKAIADDYTAIHAAARNVNHNKSEDYMEVLIEKVSADSCCAHPYAAPFILHLPATAKVRDEGGSNDALKKLLEAQEKSKKCTPLLIAAERGHLKCVHLLLQNGANVEAVDSDGWSASHRASYGGHSKVVKLLIERGANINRAAIKEGGGGDLWRPIHAAARSLQVRRAGCAFNVPIILTNTALRYVQLDAVSVLLKKNAKVDVKSNDGNNPLLMASYNGQLDMVKELLKQVCRMVLGRAFRKAFALINTPSVRAAQGCGYQLSRQGWMDCSHESLLQRACQGRQGHPRVRGRRPEREEG